MVTPRPIEAARRAAAILPGLMQRIALALAVWSLLLLTIAGLAKLAQPEAGPPMPRSPAARTAMDALVPESEIDLDGQRRQPRPDELSGTVAPDTSAVDLETDLEAAAEAAASAVTKSDGAPNSQAAVDPASVPGSVPSTEPVPVVRPTRPQTEASTGAFDGGNHGLGALPAGVPAEEEGLGLHVVRSDGRPAIDAVVRWMQQSDLDLLRAQGIDPFAQDSADALASSTRTLRTNSNGFAMLTSEAGTMWMDARLGDQYGAVQIRREDQGHVRLVLARDTTLEVVVVDAQGDSRAGVPVVLRGGGCQTIWSARTDAEGRVRLLHADGVVQAARSRYEDLTISVDAPRGDGRALPRGEIPVEPVKLVAKPGGRVLVWVHDVSGRPCARATRVRLAPIGMEADCGAARERDAVDGLAVFEDVAADSAFVVVAESACSPIQMRAEVRTSSAAETSVALTAQFAMPRVRGRLLDPRGKPWRSYAIVAYVASGPDWIARGSQTTGDRGEFELDLPDLHAPSASDASAHVAITLVAKNDYGRTVCSQRIELSTESADVVRDLGDVAANDWPVLVRGSVMDEANRPIEGALVEMCDADGRPDPRTRTECDDRAQFELRGPAPESDAVLVRAVEPERRAADATVALRRGEWRAKVVIAVHGKLRGSVLLPENAPQGSVLAHVSSASGAQLALSVDGDGKFEFSNVEPGESRVTFSVQGFENEMLTVDRVGIPRGGTCTDPRLQNVDLRTLTTVVELEVVDENGQPIESGWAGPVSEGRARGTSYEMVDGIARVLIARNGPALQVSADGYEPVVLQSPVGRVRVEMRPEGQ